MDSKEIISQLTPKQILKLLELIGKEQQQQRIDKNLSGPRPPIHRPTERKGMRVLTKKEIEYWKRQNKLLKLTE